MEANSNAGPMERTERRRLTYVGLWALGTVAFVGLTVGGYPALGTVAFFALGAAAVALHGASEAILFDERDAEILRTASTNTIQVFSYGSAIVFPVVSALAGLGYISFPLWLAPVGLFVAGLFLVWFGFVLLTRRG